MINQLLIVLGTEYSIEYKSEAEDHIMKNVDGYTDKTTKRIVIIADSEKSDLDDFSDYQRKVLRHEIVHAFLFESGLHGNARYSAEEGQEHPEMIVDWFAVQGPKIYAAWERAGAL